MKMFLFLLFICSCLATVQQQPPRSFQVENDRFVKDNQIFTIKAGSFHYFRVPYSHLRQRIQKCKDLGLNALEVYVPWNYHEPQPGLLDFTTLDPFFDMVKNEFADLVILLRPGPYICAEWDFGGLPWFLLAEDGLQIRTYEPKYIAHVTRWWTALFSHLMQNKMFYKQGGPVVMVQIENEFGFYGDVVNNPNDLKYMKYLRSLAGKLIGNDVLFYTTDNGEANMEKGTLKGSAVITMGDFGPSQDPAVSFAAQKKFNPKGMSPNMCTEFYAGWLTHWSDKTVANTSSIPIVNGLQKILSLNGSFSLYMAHGGTNFDFWSGANLGSSIYDYQPIITSYDYNAPISEDGRDGYGADGENKFEAIQRVLRGSVQPHSNPSVGSYGTIQLTSGVELMPHLDDLQTSQYPVIEHHGDLKSMERFGQPSGYIVYSTIIPPTLRSQRVVLNDYPRDVVSFFINNTIFSIQERTQGKVTAVTGPNIGTNYKLSLMIEDRGRVNFGHDMKFESKGLVKSPYLDNELLNGTWKINRLPFNFDQIDYLQTELPRRSQGDLHVPYAVFGTFRTNTSVDTYFRFKGFSRGFIVVNGHNIGRYFDRGAPHNFAGPQKALYCPRDYIYTDVVNHVAVVEFENQKTLGSIEIETRDTPLWAK